MLLFTVFYKPKCSSNELLPQGMLEKGLLRTDPSSFSCSNDINPLKFPTYMILSCAHALRVSEVWSRFLSKLHQHHYQLYWQCHTVCSIASWWCFASTGAAWWKHSSWYCCYYFTFLLFSQSYFRFFFLNIQINNTILNDCCQSLKKDHAYHTLPSSQPQQSTWPSKKERHGHFLLLCQWPEYFCCNNFSWSSKETLSAHKPVAILMFLS